MKKLEKENFDELIKSGTVLVDFYADWCGPCRMMAVVLEEIQDKVNIVKVNVDEHEELAAKYGVMSIPTLIVFKDGKLVSKEIGFRDKETILSWLDK